MGNWQGRLAVVEFAISGADHDTARVVAARVALFEDDGTTLASWDWGSDRTDAVVGEVAQTLRTALAVGIPIATFDAVTGLTVLDRECRRRGIPPLGQPSPILDALVLDSLIDPEFDGPRTLNAMAERYGVGPGSLAAGRIVRAMTNREEFAGTPAALHARQRGMVDGWPVVPLDDIRTIQDTQPIPAPALRPSDTVPMFDFAEGGMLALPSSSAEEPVPEPSPDVAPVAEATSAATPAPRRIHVAAAIVTDRAGRAIVVRKTGTTGFMQPGGKIERGESALATLIRELREEIGLEVDVDATEFLGSFEAAALNEPGQIVRAEVFAVTTDEDLRPGAEIEEIYWLESPDDTGTVELAPLTLDVMLPLWAGRRPALF